MALRIFLICSSVTWPIPWVFKYPVMAPTVRPIVWAAPTYRFNGSDIRVRFSIFLDTRGANAVLEVDI